MGSIKVYLNRVLLGRPRSWEIVVQGRDTTPPQETNYQELKKWKVQAGKAMFIIKVSVERRKI